MRPAIVSRSRDNEPRPLAAINDDLRISRQAVGHTAGLVERAGDAGRRRNPDRGRSNGQLAGVVEPA